MDDIQFRTVSEGKVKWLEREVTEQEILVALEDIEGDKAPGPDDFYFKFIKACWKRRWGARGADFIEVFKEFYENSALNKGLRIPLSPTYRKVKVRQNQPTLDQSA